MRNRINSSLWEIQPLMVRYGCKMNSQINTACACNIGLVRMNNEDNFLFDGKCMEAENRGLKKPVFCNMSLSDAPVCMAVFDGMGGEEFGELAAFAAAMSLKESLSRLSDYVVPEKRFLSDSCRFMNRAVYEKARELGTANMGTTSAILLFSGHDVYACNLGDSKAFRLRSGEFMQLTRDHTDAGFLQENGIQRKPLLTQYLGIDPDEIQIIPYIAKGTIMSGDQYLICSDGLTDMLSNVEICSIMSIAESAEACVEALVNQALKHGGKDNITVIVARVC